MQYAWSHYTTFMQSETGEKISRADWNYLPLIKKKNEKRTQSDL